MRIGIRYCGGCNPTYDRVAAVRFLKENYPDEVWEYVNLDRPSRYDVILAVTGCGKECIPKKQLQACAAELLFINQREDIRAASEKIRTFLKSSGGSLLSSTDSTR